MDVESEMNLFRVIRLEDAVCQAFVSWTLRALT